MIRPNPNASTTAQQPADNERSLALIKDLAQMFKLLADETRLRILDMLGRRKELCVRDMWERLGQSQPAVSHHLGLLRMAGLVGTRQEGKHIYYRIDQQRFNELMAMIQETRVGAKVLSGSNVSEDRRDPVSANPTPPDH